MKSKLKAIVYGKKGCHLCDNRKMNLEKFPSSYQKQTGKELEIGLEYHDIGTVEGLVKFCMEDRSNADIPIVILEDEKGKTLQVYAGPTAVISTRSLMEMFEPTAKRAEA